MTATQHIRELIRARVPRTALSEAVLQLADIHDRHAQQIEALQQALLELQTSPGCQGCNNCKPKAEGKPAGKGSKANKSTAILPASSETAPTSTADQPAVNESLTTEQSADPAEQGAAPQPTGQDTDPGTAGANTAPDEPEIGAGLPETQE